MLPLLLVFFLVASWTPADSFSSTGRQRRLRVGTSRQAAFNLDTYVADALLPRPVPSVAPAFVALDTAVAAHAENRSYVILADLSVRTLDDISPTLSRFPFWPKLVAKLTASKQSLAEDKFLYQHDVGDSCVCSVAIARVPLHPYQQLDLARKIVGGMGCFTHGAGAAAVVCMVSTFGEALLDPHMAGALVSAAAAKQFVMPRWVTVFPLPIPF